MEVETHSSQFSIGSPESRRRHGSRNTVLSFQLDLPESRRHHESRNTTTGTSRTVQG